MAIFQYQVLDGATGTTAEPSAVTDGVELRTGLSQPATSHVFLIKSTAGTGTVRCICKLWGYHAALAGWYPIGPSGAADSQGRLNNNAVDAWMDEVTADSARYAEVLNDNFWGLAFFSRVYCQVTHFSGTGASFNAWLVPTPQ